MITTFSSSSARDFRQQFEGTIGWVIPESKRELMVYVESVNDRRVALRDINGFDYQITDNSGIAFRFQQVDSGWYPYKDAAAYMWRVPARQWSRGVSSNNTRIVYLRENGTFDNLPVDITTLSELYSGKKVKGLISKHLYISLQGGVFMHRQLIGKVNEKLATISLSNDLFLQEVIDIVRRNSLSYKVSHV